MRFEGDTSARYTYEYGANGQIAQVTDHTLGRVTTSEYDLANRPVNSVTRQGSQHVYTASVGYDAYNNLQYFMEKVGASLNYYRTWFTYDRENRPIRLDYSDGSILSYTYDSIGRLLKRTLTVGSAAYETACTYTAGSNGGNTTPLIAGMTQTGESCAYTYTDTRNIASETRNGLETRYTYDGLGQLIRVDDQTDLTSGDAGTTWTWEYDRGGNILTKKRYAYTIGAPGTVKETFTYGYGTAYWKDQLTSISVTADDVTTTKAITYDAVGNPLNDGTWTYTWEHGRQLKQMTNGSVTATFVYNKDGLRCRKTVNGVATYIALHGTQVVHQSSSDGHHFHFFYDAQGKVSEIRYNGAAYGVIHILQGDVSRRAQWAMKAGEVPVSHRAQRAAACCATMAN